MKTMKILLVDDEVEFASTLAERLEFRGFTIKCVHDGEEALEAIRAQPPDLVLLDMMMPGVSGLDVLAEMKQHHKDIPVILMTGRGAACQEENEEDESVYCYLIKPVDIDVLIAKMQAALDEAGKPHQPYC